MNQNKEYSEELNLHGIFGGLTGINLLKFFGHSIVYDIMIFGMVIWIFYKSIRHIVKYKKYKNPIIAMVLAIVINLLFSVIRIMF